MEESGVSTWFPRRIPNVSSGKGFPYHGLRWRRDPFRSRRHRLNEGLPVKLRKPAPYEFVLDTLAPVRPFTRSMFGCVAVYVGEKIVLLLRHKSTSIEDNGVWLATTPQHHASLGREFPNMRTIKLLGKEVTGWQVLPADAEDFEQAAMHAAELILAGDPRIGKIPGERRRRPTTNRAAKKGKLRRG
jgi:hypothetical protein